MTLQEPQRSDLRDLTSLFFAIHLVGGHIGLPILVITFLFSKKANRHPTVINFCVTWILYSIIYCLLIYGGTTLMNDPPHALCLTQAAMHYAAPPMAVVACFELVLQIWSTFITPWKEARLTRVPRWLKLAAIIMPPYITFFAFAIPAYYEGLTNPSWVQVKNGLYCGLLRGRFEMFAVPAFCSVFLILIIGFEVATVVRFLKGRQIIKRDFPLADAPRPSLSPWCRAALFLVYAALTLGACVTDLKQGSTTFVDMIQASLPLAAFLIFGSHKDVALTWFYWNCKPKWDPGVADRPHQIAREISHLSDTTIDSTTPITTHGFSGSNV